MNRFHRGKKIYVTCVFPEYENFVHLKKDGLIRLYMRDHTNHLALLLGTLRRTRRAGRSRSLTWA